MAEYFVCSSIIILLSFCWRSVRTQTVEMQKNHTDSTKPVTSPMNNGISMRSYLNRLSDILQLPASENAFSAPEIRQAICEQRIQTFLQNETFFVTAAQVAEDVDGIRYNHTALGRILCELEGHTSYEQYFFSLWANSTERFIGKALLENAINPILQFVVLISLIMLACPIFYKLSRSELRLGLWHFLLVYSLVGCIRALLVYLPNVILRVVALVHSRPKITQHARLDNLGVFACPTINFVDQVLLFMPNSIVPIIIWDQICRQRSLRRQRPGMNTRQSVISAKLRPIPASATATVPSASGINADSSLNLSQTPNESPRIKRDFHRKQREAHGSISISTQNTLIRE